MTVASARDINCVVFGAGALGLGFLGRELAPRCRITYLDIPAKADLLNHLRRAGGYVINETGLSVAEVSIAGVDARCVDDGTAVTDCLDAADIVMTAVGEANLARIAPALAEAAACRESGRPLRVICSENGVDVARRLRAAVEREAGRDLEGRLLTGDSVMGRMCKIVLGPPPPLAPVAPGLGWAVVAEQFFGIPVERHVFEGLAAVPDGFVPEDPPRFAASMDVKMLSHNGLHAVLACLGRLAGARHFDELRDDAGLMGMARRLLVEEAGRALFAKHGPALPRDEYLNYCDSILRRITCPVLHDEIARGVRGVMRKLAPDERLVYSVRTVAEQDVTPAGYAKGLAAAVVLARREGETELDFRDVLTQHCGFDSEADARLIALIEELSASL